MSAQIDMDNPLNEPTTVRDTPPGAKADPAGTSSPAGSAPKPKGRKAGDAQLKLDLKEIEEKLSRLLELPAVPMVATGDVWPAQHIEAQAAPLAKAIANACKDNPQLRAKLLQLLRVSDNANLGIAVFRCLAPILLYYGILPAPPLLRAQLGVPNRSEARGPTLAEQMEDAIRSQNAPPPPSPATNEPTPAGQPPAPQPAPLP
jgi:hypothetical protein